MNNWNPQEAINLDLEPRVVSYRIGGKNYLLREASAAAKGRYEGARLRGSEVVQGSDGRMTVKRVDSATDAEAVLVAGCLFELIERGPPGSSAPAHETPVALATVTGWPARIVTPLFDKALEISGLVEKDTAEGLTKQIAGLQERLAKIQAVQANGKHDPEDYAKNLPAATTGNSG